MLWCVYVAIALLMTFNSLVTEKVDISDGMILDSVLTAQKKILNDDKHKLTKRKFGHAHKTNDGFKCAHHSSRFNSDLEHGRLQALVLEMATRQLAEKLGLKTVQERQKLRGVGNEVIRRVRKKPLQQKIFAQSQCSSSRRYRNIDGTCNNLQNPGLGSANSALVRFPGAGTGYADGISEPRKAQSGHSLPNARTISFTLFTNEDRPSTIMSHMAMTWGQYLDHDITLAAIADTTCHGACQDLARGCFGILIPPDDPHFKTIGVRCISLKRDAPATSMELATPREHVNILTAYIDASQVYDVNDNKLAALRDTSSDSGLMKEVPHPSGVAILHGLLPVKTSGFCRTNDPVNEPCFLAGDARINVNAGLAALHTIAARDHNRIARELKDINPKWSGEKIFQETRKITAAYHQHITYNEFLPEILDQSFIDRYGLGLQTEGFYTGYNSTVDPSIINSFAAAAFRFGHSQVQDLMNRYSKKYQTKYTPAHTKQYFDPGPLYDVSHGGVDGIIRGLVKDPSQRVDKSFSKAVQEQLIRGPGDVSDLAAINIQRGRERGLPGYNKFRALCGLQEAQSFEDFKTEISLADVEKMANIYEHPNDVDLFVGGLLEEHVGSGALGQSFSCLIAEQFRRLRSGDRFWYENEGEAGFTVDQLQELRKVSLARMLCDNGDGIEVIPKEVLSASSVEVACESLPTLDLTKWKDSAA